MPELPEVETILRGLAPHLTGACIVDGRVHFPKLRREIPDLRSHCQGQIIQSLSRRAKTLRFHFDHGCLLMHFGMSGKALLRPYNRPKIAHNHASLLFETQVLDYVDPRRFGAIDWSDDPQGSHYTLQGLGPEPLAPDFTGTYLYTRAQSSRRAIKNIIMDATVVTGVGNIYATEALFLAGIAPHQPGHTLQLLQLERLVKTIGSVLKTAIAQGGTTLKDFAWGENQPGYFQQDLKVYGRKNQACVQCQHPIQTQSIGQRTSAWCPQCQPWDE